jgi:hypothetical protein
MFIEQLNTLAKSLNVLRGTLSRWLLPFDNNTRIDEQCSTPHSVVDKMPDIVRGKISERQVPICIYIHIYIYIYSRIEDRGVMYL